MPEFSVVEITHCQRCGKVVVSAKDVSQPCPRSPYRKPKGAHTISLRWYLDALDREEA